MLESVGAYNQRFMANSIDEIVRFPELYRNNENFQMHDAVDVDQVGIDVLKKMLIRSVLMF